MQVARKELVAYTIDTCSLNEFHHVTNPKRLIGKRCLLSFMHSYFGMKPGKGGESILLATTRVLLMQSINTPSRALRLSLCSEYSSSQQFMILRFSHSGSLLERILWRMQHLVMIIRSLLILVYRYLPSSPDHHICARSCIPSLQLPRSKHSAEV